MRAIMLGFLVGLLWATTAQAATCDPTDPSHCLFPWPNDRFTAPADTDTGKRLDLPLTGMPKNVAGVPVDPSPYHRNDGFSPGQLLITHVPGLDPVATGLVGIGDMGRAFDPDQPLVVIDAATGQRHPVWAELDRHPLSAADPNLLIRPSRNFEEGHRYVVGLRRMRRADGSLIEPSAAFKAIRGGQSDARYERIFGTLAGAGVARSELFLAWDFTVASERNLSERMLHLRDDAFALLGDLSMADVKVQGKSPVVTVTKVEDFTPEQDARIARRVEGRVLVPCYLDAPGCPPGSRFRFEGGSNRILRIPFNQTAAPFICNIPRRAFAAPVRPSLYGHGLLGSADEVDSGKLKAIAQDHGFAFCATDWAGMSTEDLPNAVSILANLERFPTLADRVQQGMLNFLYLGRAMIHPKGFAALPEFAGLLDTARLDYVGGSQGGIIGGALAAVAPDFERAALGVPGMNYSTLLDRSVDFDEYAQVMYAAYPDPRQRPLLLSLIQILWDRAEANGYAHHITGDPYPRTPDHDVLLHEAFGDHQVANIATEVEARTLGIPLRAPALDPGRSRHAVPFWDIPAIGGFPYAGSALVVWDVGPVRGNKGTDAPPDGNEPNRVGVDPHGPDASETAGGQRQIAEFLKSGQVVEVCGLAPCYLDGYTGPAGG